MNEKKEQKEEREKNDDCLGCNFLETSPVTLRDGRTVCTSCPDWRLETEARSVVNMEGKKARTDYLAGVEKQRGKASCDLLRDEVLAQWALRAAVAEVQGKVA